MRLAVSVGAAIAVLSLCLLATPSAGYSVQSDSAICHASAVYVNGAWLKFDSRVDRTQFAIIKNRQPYIETHNVRILFTTRGLNGSSDFNPEAVTMKVGYAALTDSTFRTLVSTVHPDVPTADDLTHVPSNLPGQLRTFASSVMWSATTRRLIYIFRSRECGEWRVVLKYNPRVGLVQPIPLGSVQPTAPTVASACQLTQLTLSSDTVACDRLFDPAQNIYTCAVPYRVFLVDVNAQLGMSGPTASLFVNGTNVATLKSGVSSASLALTEGVTELLVRVTYGTLCRNQYTLTIARWSNVTTVVNPEVDVDVDANNNGTDVDTGVDTGVDVQPLPQGVGNWLLGDFSVCQLADGTPCPSNAVIETAVQTRTITCVNEAMQQLAETECAGVSAPDTTVQCTMVCPATEPTTLPTTDASGAAAGSTDSSQQQQQPSQASGASATATSAAMLMALCFAAIAALMS